MRSLTKLFIALVIVVVIAGVVWRVVGDKDEGVTYPGNHVVEGGKLILASDGWSGTDLPNYVLKSIFEDELGYSVEITDPLSVEEAYEEVDSGMVHVYADGWFPVQDHFVDRYPDLLKLGQTYGGKARDAYEGWLVPSDFAQQYSLTHVKDLEDQQVVQALNGTLIGAPEAWNASKCNDGILEDYGLTALYHQEHGSEGDLMQRVAARIDQGQPTLFYLCLPYAYPTVVPVDNMTWLEGTAERLPLSFVRSVVRSDFIVNHPGAAEVLSRYSIPGEDISWAMEQIAQKGKSPTEVAKTWIENHREEVNAWLEGIV